jgi:hypothetical protein
MDIADFWCGEPVTVHSIDATRECTSDCWATPVHKGANPEPVVWIGNHADDCPVLKRSLVP